MIGLYVNCASCSCTKLAATAARLQIVFKNLEEIFIFISRLQQFFLDFLFMYISPVCGNSKDLSCLSSFQIYRRFYVVITMTFMTSYLATISKKFLVCLIIGRTTTTPTTVSAQTSKANISAQGAQNPLKKSQNFQRDKEI